MYQNQDGEIPVKEFLQSTHKKIQAKFKFMIEYIVNEKNCLCEPYVKHFTIEKYKQLYEIRIKAARTMVRIIFYKADDNIILLHAFYKKDKKDTEHALEESLKILKALDGKALYPFENLTEVNTY